MSLYVHSQTFCEGRVSSFRGTAALSKKFINSTPPSQHSFAMVSSEGEGLGTSLDGGGMGAELGPGTCLPLALDEGRGMELPFSPTISFHLPVFSISL